MNDKLISCEILKEAINTHDKFACLSNGKLEPMRNLEHPEDFVEYVRLDDIIKAIDGAPPINFMVDPRYITEIQNLNKKLGKLLEEERPYGEWITTTKDNGVSYQFFCSNCNREVQVITDYCPYCGADMREGDINGR